MEPNINKLFSLFRSRRTSGSSAIQQQNRTLLPGGKWPNFLINFNLSYLSACLCLCTIILMGQHLSGPLRWKLYRYLSSKMDSSWNLIIIIIWISIVDILSIFTQNWYNLKSVLEHRNIHFLNNHFTYWIPQNWYWISELFDLVKVKILKYI